MTPQDVVLLYKDLRAAGIRIWIDGGWCVDALLGRPTREHEDVDIAVERRHAVQLRAFLTSRGYVDEARDDTTEWNYAMREGSRLVDVHLFEFDDAGNNVYGVKYPHDSLTGTGTIDGETVDCVEPRWMFRFKIGHEPREKDLVDVRALGAAFGFEIPDGYR